MAKINKKGLDGYINLMRKYYKTGDVDLLEARNKHIQQAFGKERLELSNKQRNLLSIIDQMCVSSYTYDNATIYKVIEILGFEVCEMQ